MSDELKNAIAGSLPADATPESLPEDVNIKKEEPSPSAPQPSEATETKAVEKEEPFHNHPRWKERQRELEEARRDKQILAEQNAKLMSLVEKSQASPTEDPYKGYSEEQRSFYSDLDKRIKSQVEPIKAENERLKEAVETGKHIVTSMMYERFIDKHPDVKDDEGALNEIASYVQSGYSMERAYQATKNPKLISELQAENQRLKAQLENKKITNKQSANLETSTTDLKQNPQLRGKEKATALVEDFLKTQ